MSDQLRAINPPNLADAAEMLWVVLSNVSGSDWSQQTQEWQEAAARWRDYYFQAVEAAGPKSTTLPPGGDAPAAPLTDHQKALIQWREDSEILRHSNIIEIAVRNESGSVSDYMNHWEGRALKAETEAAHASQQAALEMKQAEINVLRGANCEVDGDGPCGVCLKCKDRQFASQQVAWTRLADLFKTGGLDDPMFLVGMVEAEHQQFASQQAALRALEQRWRTLVDDLRHSPEYERGAVTTVAAVGMLSKCADDLARLLGAAPGAP